MRGRKRLSMFLRSLTSRQSVEAELDEEMRFHIDMQADAHSRLGVAPDEAQRKARVAFGGVEQHKEAMREGRGVRGIERAAFDVRFALRQLRRTPGFTLAAVLTLALGIGGNTAVFSVVNGVLLRPLAYPDADRIVSIGHRTRGGDLPERLPSSSAAHVVYQDGSKSFDALALYTTWQGSLIGESAPPDWVDVVTTTRGLFDVLRVSPSLGRAFTPEEDAPGGPHVAVISDALWRQRFGADPLVVGRTITLDGTPRTVIGVMPATFAFPTPASQLWVPMRIDRSDLSGFNLQGIGRLRHDATPESATRELTTLLPRVSSVVDFLSPQTLRDANIRPDVRTYLDEVVGNVRPVLWTLWAMVGLVLLIACVNVASLLLVRAETRRREVALRIALGAERRHLLAQSCAESAMLLLAGSALGALFAWTLVTVLPRLAPALLPRAGDIRVDATVIGATTLIAAMIAVVFGVLPVARHRSLSASTAFRGGDRTSTSGRTGVRLRQLLVGAQVAMATVLLVGSGLVLRSFEKLRAVDPGFRAEGVITFRLALPMSRYGMGKSVARFHYEMLDRIRALPGVTAAGATGRLPLAGVTVEADPLRVEGRVFGPGALPPLAEMRVATPGYFEAMGIPTLAGRTLERSDTDRGTGAVLVTEAVVRKLMESRNPIGTRVAHGLPGVRGAKPWSDVVGVVGDVRGISLDKPPMGAVYYAMVNRSGVDMEWLARSMVYVVRTTAAPSVVIAAVRRELGQIDPTLPLAETRTLSSVVAAAQSGMRFSMIGFSIAAIIGLFMSAIGLYGVLSYVTAQRTREIGVRIALGATPSSVRVAVLRRGLVVSGAGLIVGLIGAVLMRRLATPLLYGITPTDPLTLAAVSCSLMLVGTLATWLPARRAARLDPVMALRGE